MYNCNKNAMPFIIMKKMKYLGAYLAKQYRISVENNKILMKQMS
jgi:hypothetical protein